MDSTTKQRTHWSKAALKLRGWTDAMSARFLPQPDREAPNPRFKSAAPMKLYDSMRVEALEAAEEYRTAKQKSLCRRESAKKATVTKTRKTVSAVESIVLPAFPLLTPDELTRRACEHYNSRDRSRYLGRRDDGDERSEWVFAPASPRSDPHFLARISVNFLRHALSPYDLHCAALERKVGKDQAYLVIRRKILAAITETYPWLADQCAAQERCGEEQVACKDFY